MHCEFSSAHCMGNLQHSLLSLEIYFFGQPRNEDGDFSQINNKANSFLWTGHHILAKPRPFPTYHIYGNSTTL